MAIPRLLAGAVTSGKDQATLVAEPQLVSVCTSSAMHANDKRGVRFIQRPDLHIQKNAAKQIFCFANILVYNFLKLMDNRSRVHSKVQNKNTELASKSAGLYYLASHL